MKILRSALIATTLLGAGAVAERQIDPFGWHPHDYILEEHGEHSEVFIPPSSNWYDQNGEKHDDRVGDTFMLVALLSGAGALALSLRNTELETKISAETDNSVT